MTDIYMNEEERDCIIYDGECPYFEDGRVASTEYILPADKYSKKFGEFLAKGYRRYYHFLYRNICGECEACIPLRMEVDKFRPSRSQRRTLRKNTDLKVSVLSPPVFEKQKVLLFEKYLHHKHGKDPMISDAGDSLSRIFFGFGRAIEMDYYLGDRLIGAGIVDESPEAFSSNYFFYDTDFPEKRFGVFSLLMEISLARQMGKRFMYLGFYIEQNRKMSYKKFFRPNQILERGEWKDFKGQYEES